MGVKIISLSEIRPWSERKLEILRKYSHAYTTILKGTSLTFIYIDAFAGEGEYVSEETGKIVPGSPLTVLDLNFPFQEYHFVDVDPGKTQSLKELTRGFSNSDDIYVYEGNSNKILPEKIFPRARYEDYRRALCLLDPYGLHLDWKVIYEAGQMNSIEVMLNFPVMDMNMNVLLNKPNNATETQKNRMNKFWGDQTWREVAYSESKQSQLFGDPEEEKTGIKELAREFQKRLKKVAGFKYVPDPILFKNRANAPLYYIVFATQNAIGAKIFRDISKDYIY